MAFESIREQLKDQFLELKSRVEESPAFQTLKERFENLSVPQQRGVIAGSVFLTVAMLLAIPYSYYSSSTTYVESFEDSRQLLRRLLRASRMAGEASAIPPGLSVGDLRNRVQNELQTMTLTPEQIGELSDIPSNGPPPARDVVQSSLGVNLKNLNLKQIVDIGYRLQNLNPGTKLTGLDVTATTEDDHYFNVNYQLTMFTVTAQEEAPAASSSRPRPGNRDQEEEESE